MALAARVVEGQPDKSLAVAPANRVKTVEKRQARIMAKQTVRDVATLVRAAIPQGINSIKTSTAGILRVYKPLCLSYNELDLKECRGWHPFGHVKEVCNIKVMDMNHPVKVLLVVVDPRESSLARAGLADVLGGGFQVTAHTGDRDALAELSVENFDVVLLDAHGAQPSQLEEISTVIALLSPLPMVLLADEMDEELALWALSQGVRECLEREQISGDVLARMLRRAIHRHETDALERLHGAALNAAANGIIITDATGKIVWVNPAFVTLTGYSSRDVIGQNTRLLKSGVHDTAFYRGLWETISSGHVWHGEMANRRKNGTLYTEEMTITPVKDHSGAITHFVAIKQDVTKRKDTEAALRESEALFRSLSAAAPIGIFMTDLKGECVYANPRYRDITGLSLMECIGTGWTKSVCEQDLERVRNAWTSFVRNGGEFSIQRRVRHPQHGLRWAQVRVFPMKSDSGETTGYVGTMEDITERLRADVLLRESEERYRNIVQNARDAIFMLSPAGQISSLNPAFETITGWKSAEWLDKEFGALVHPDDLPLAMQMFLAVTSGARVTTPFSLRIRHRDDRYVMGEFTLAPWARGDQIIGVLGIGRDVTERVALEAQLRQMQKMEGIGQLAGGVAHDFNNILTAVMGYTQLLLRDDSLGMTQRNRVQEIQKASERAASLTRQLLAFSRKQVLTPEVFDLSALVSDSAGMLRRLIGENIELVTQLASEPPHVRADRGQMDQVLLNLAVNARDAMSEGGTLTITTSVTTVDENHALTRAGASPGQYALLEVCDTGCGMSPKTMAHIFEPFFTTKEPGKGTGLGLATCFGIIKQSGGFITVESEPGRGTVFRVWLPLVASSPADALNESKISAPVSMAGHETILLVEDDPTIRELAELVLSEAGYRVLSVSDGVQALNQAQQHEGPIALLLSDVVMPQMGGKQLCDAMRATHSDIKVLFCSGYSDEMIARCGPQEPGVFFLQKPYTPTSLLRRVRATLDTVVCDLAQGQAPSSTT